MFTGIIRGVGRIKRLEPTGGDVRIGIDCAGVDLGAVALGDSIAINGVCLTVTEYGRDFFCADVSRETLSLTSLGSAQTGTRVNLEPALRAGDPLGGHIVSGHVDGLCELLDNRADARSRRLRFAAPDALAGLIAAKGSVALDGISLTVNAVSGPQFEVNIVPHTLAVTNLGERQVGDALNLEVDMLARYVQRLLTTAAGDQH